ncbi:capsule assembly Wzi family protein [Pedobacter steynii]
MKNFYILITFLICAGNLSYAQTLPVGSLQGIEDAYRRQQLLGLDTSKSSFMIRPIHISNVNSFDLQVNDSLINVNDFRKELFISENGKAAIYALPVEWRQQINTHHPYGWNDGAMIPNKGYQTLMSAGVYAKWGPLSVQLRPEFVYADNEKFTQLYETRNAVDFQAAYPRFYNNIDMPDRFGTKDYAKFNWGQSSIRLNFGPISAGVSNENLWWGPGVRNSLLMSNNAPGFKHITINTIKPINTPIGSFETQMIGGRLEKSGVAIPNGSLFTEKPDDWRYISGIAFSYQPKWVPGLFLGFDRAFIIYHKDLGNSIGDYIPLFSSALKNKFGDSSSNTEDPIPRDQYISMFARWLWPESHAEFYFQYARTDHSYNLRDFLAEPEHSRAYIAGIRKLIPLRRASDEFIQVGAEFTQIEVPGVKTVRAEGYFYTHTRVKAGYTNVGQVLGAGIGPGSNLQSIDVAWVKGLKKIGFQMERLANNNDLLYQAGIYTSDSRRHWIDMSFAGKFDWTYKNFIFNSQLTYIRSLNYQYQFDVVPGAGLGTGAKLIEIILALM